MMLRECEPAAGAEIEIKTVLEWKKGGNIVWTPVQNSCPYLNEDLMALRRHALSEADAQARRQAAALANNEVEEEGPDVPEEEDVEYDVPEEEEVVADTHHPDSGSYTVLNELELPDIAVDSEGYAKIASGPEDSAREPKEKKPKESKAVKKLNDALAAQKKDDGKSLIVTEDLRRKVAEAQERVNATQRPKKKKGSD